MRKDVARKLIAELESGRWRKGRHRLGAGIKTRCCLGVLQEIAPKNLPRHDLFREIPDVRIRDWAGLRSGETIILADENDNSPGWPIAKIKEIAGIDE